MQDLILQFLKDNWLVLFLAAWGAWSEIMSLNPRWKNNGIIQFLICVGNNFLRRKGFLVVFFTFMFLGGCTIVGVEVKYNEDMKPMSCHANYVNILKDVDAAQFAVCNGTADVVQSSVNLDALKALSAAIGALAGR